jgi:hypothetical protein
MEIMPLIPLRFVEYNFTCFKVVFVQRNEVELKALFPSNRTVNRYVILNKNELEIREVVFTKRKGK